MTTLSDTALKRLISIREHLNERAVLIDLFSGDSEELITIDMTFELTKDMIDNYDGAPVITTVGRFIVNQIMFVDTFGSLVPYLNKLKSINSVSTELCSMLLDDKITVAQFRSYLDAAYRLLHFSELFMPTFTKKSFSTDPKISGEIDKFVNQHKDTITNPKVINELETKIVKMDKDYIASDPSADYYNAMGSSAYDIHRKKIFSTVGGIDDFGSTDHVFIRHALADGWNPEAMADIANEIRKASYNRGTETAKGGELTKYIMRAFENVKIIEEDCGTTKGINVLITNDNIDYYVGRYMVVGKTSVLLTKDNIAQYLNKIITIRSNMCCSTIGGLCYKCVNKRFKDIEAQNIGLHAIDISSSFLTFAMKNMHGTVISTTNCWDKKFFVVPQ